MEEMALLLGIRSVFITDNSVKVLYAGTYIFAKRNIK
jgi:hypothetical protein